MARILLVDDEATVRRIMELGLSKGGHSIRTAENGQKALDAILEESPDLLITDIEMPRMDGYEVATHVRNTPRLKGTPIVMVTSRVGDKHRNRAMELGVNAYLGKPFQEAQLLEAIKPLLASRRAAVAQS